MILSSSWLDLIALLSAEPCLLDADCPNYDSTIFEFDFDLDIFLNLLDLLEEVLDMLEEFEPSVFLRSFFLVLGFKESMLF